MLVADDYQLEAGGKEYRFALTAFFVVCSIVGVPLSWNKTSGGETVTWVGFELLHRTRQLGISQRRADWFRKWTTEVASSSSVHMASFEEGLGRVMYVAGALEYERPFLGPLYRFMSLHPRDSVRAVPPYVSFFLRHLAAQISELKALHPNQLAPRVDAQASSDRTGIGGWYPHVDQSGQVNVKLSRWFSLDITRDEWPWVFEKSSKPALIISTLEALAELRIPVDARQLQWTVLREALSHGKEAEDAYQAAKTVGFPVRNQRMRRKKRPEERLKAVDPW